MRIKTIIIDIKLAMRSEKILNPKRILQERIFYKGRKPAQGISKFIFLQMNYKVSFLQEIYEVILFFLFLKFFFILITALDFNSSIFVCIVNCVF